MVAHAREDHPDEACGVVIGPEDTMEPVEHIRVTNAARSATFYEYDDQEWFEIDKLQYDKVDPKVVVVAYHSHTMTEAYPSPSDIELASKYGLPQAHYVLILTTDPEVAEVRSFRIADGEVTEEPIEAVGAPDAVQTYKFAHSPDSTVYDCH